MRRNKYNNIRSGGYDSNLERTYGDKLALLAKTGAVREYIHHPPSVKMCSGTITWAVDYWVRLIDDEECYVEVKGMPTPEFRLKFKLYKWLQAHWEPDMLPVLVVVKGGKIWDNVGANEIIKRGIL